MFLPSAERSTTRQPPCRGAGRSGRGRARRQARLPAPWGESIVVPRSNLGRACPASPRRSHGEDAAGLQREILELGGGADVIAGNLDKLGGWQVATARIAGTNATAPCPGPLEPLEEST